MCRWMGSHAIFTAGLTVMTRVAFSVELLEWKRKFSGVGGSKNSGR